ncbi:hypothetical protein [Rhizobium setariae]|nr:hypothetical protein [Rhizobium setariae]
MSKEKNKGSKEARKPKAAKPAKQPPVSTFVKPVPSYKKSTSNSS